MKDSKEFTRAWQVIDKKSIKIYPVRVWVVWWRVCVTSPAAIPAPSSAVNKSEKQYLVTNDRQKEGQSELVWPSCRLLSNYKTEK